jgi:hypothetical protein
VRLIHLEHVILRPIVDEVVGAIGEPTVQDWLESVMIIRHSDDELVLDPDQAVLEDEA